MNYYKATDGTKTVFRATERTYGSAKMAGRGGISFSAAGPKPGWYPVVAITQAEFAALTAAKMMRQDGRDRLQSPQDSWVLNTALAGV